MAEIIQLFQGRAYTILVKIWNYKVFNCFCLQTCTTGSEESSEKADFYNLKKDGDLEN